MPFSSPGGSTMSGLQAVFSVAAITCFMLIFSNMVSSITNAFVTSKLDCSNLPIECNEDWWLQIP